MTFEISTIESTVFSAGTQGTISVELGGAAVVSSSGMRRSARRHITVFSNASAWLCNRRQRSATRTASGAPVRILPSMLARPRRTTPTPGFSPGQVATVSAVRSASRSIGRLVVRVHHGRATKKPAVDREVVDPEDRKLTLPDLTNLAGDDYRLALVPLHSTATRTLNHESSAGLFIPVGD